MMVIIDYGMGNVRSVKNALEFLGFEAIISRKEGDIRNAEKLLLPGVGAFRDGMNNLKKFKLIELLSDEVLNKKKPLIGICLGMQLLAKSSEEGGQHEGLGFIDADVKLFRPDPKDIKVPHIGWNNINIVKEDVILKDIPDGSDFYFVHSYHVMPNENEDITTSYCDYGERFVSTLNKGNIYAAQFHPEKSQDKGLKILENFGENA